MTEYYDKDYHIKIMKFSIKLLDGKPKSIKIINDKVILIKDKDEINKRDDGNG